MIPITFLGTAAMVPTKQRAPSSVFLRIEGTGVLLDCGEGTQRQMNIAGINRNQIDVICLSHWHADHVAGLLCLLQTLNAKEGSHDVTIIGPVETKERLQHLFDATIFENKLRLTIIEHESDEPKEVWQNKDFAISAVNLQHSTPVIGFSLQLHDRWLVDKVKQRELGVADGPQLAQLKSGKEIHIGDKVITREDVCTHAPGKKITYVTDTAFCQQAIDLASHSTLVISEATYTAKHEDKAEQYLHMTSTQAAQIASISESDHLVITHFSQRYKNSDEHLEQAKEVFPNTKAAHDLLTVEL